MTALPADDPAPQTETVDQPVAAEPPPRLRGRLILLAGLGVLLALLLYYPVGAWRANVIDDSLSFAPPQAAAEESKAVAMAAALIRREIDTYGWMSNKPFFMPAAILDDMPNYQRGMIAAIGRFAIEMNDLIGRAEGDSPQADDDLSRAAGLLQYPGNIWMIDPRVPWATTISTEKQYRNAARALEAYNQRLAGGSAAFNRHAEVLQAVLERFGKDLDETAAGLDGAASHGGGWFDWRADDVYYAAKGRAYATLLLLRSLGEDDAALLAERNLGEAWQAMLATLAGAATARPWVVLAGSPQSTLVPNHPAMLGYHLLRARSQMAALAEALR